MFYSILEFTAILLASLRSVYSGSTQTNVPNVQHIWSVKTNNRANAVAHRLLNIVALNQNNFLKNSISREFLLKHEHCRSLVHYNWNLHH